jgi:hypothetical protein
MSLFRFFKSRGTAPVARERLQILLAHERVALGPAISSQFSVMNCSATVECRRMGCATLPRPRG